MLQDLQVLLRGVQSDTRQSLLSSKWSHQTGGVTVKLSLLSRPGKDDDFTQHALDTVVAAAGAVASQARMTNPELKETPHIR